MDAHGQAAQDLGVQPAQAGGAGRIQGPGAKESRGPVPVIHFHGTGDECTPFPVAKGTRSEGFLKNPRSILSPRDTYIVEAS